MEADRDEKHLKREKDEKKWLSISEEISQSEINLYKIRRYAITNGGLLGNHLRRLVWPKILKTEPSKSKILSGERIFS